MYSSLSEQQARRSRPDKSSEYHVAYLVNLFCAGGAAWSDNALDINNALGVDVASMDINTLGTSLFDNGWMGWCSSQEFPKGCPSLGDIGYMSSNGSFVRIDNLHQSLRFSGVHTYIGGPGTWESEVDDGGIVNSGGRSYHRYAEPRLPSMINLMFEKVQNVFGLHPSCGLHSGTAIRLRRNLL
jgi:hypothetical protein